MSDIHQQEASLSEDTSEIGKIDTTHNNYRSELVLGMVAPVGANMKEFEDLLTTELTNYRYKVNKVQLSTKLNKGIDKSSEFRRYQTLMDAGNELRSKKGNDFLGKVGISMISAQRSVDKENNRLPQKGMVHLIHSIKHKSEIEILREVYGGGFFLIGLYSDKKDRIEFLKHKGMTEQEAIGLILRDYDDNEKFGQQTSKVFELSDAFIKLEVNQFDKTQGQIERLLDLLFASPFLTPTRDENAMFLAYAASLRSGSLARQIGAVVADRNGEIVSTGTNDAPRFGGGQYWTGEEDSRDFQRGFDANTRQRNEILAQIIDRICSAKNLVSEAEKQKIQAYTFEQKLNLSKEIFKGTTLFDLTEFGRDVHAEMEALLTCVRIGVSVTGGSVYCTTFPCHNCAKHIVDAGIKRVVYIEAYPKSKADELHSDSLSIDGKAENKVSFEPFIGIGPRRYFDLFSLSLGTGSGKQRKDDDGKKSLWNKSDSLPRFKMKHISYLEREQRVAEEVGKSMTGGTD